MEKIINHRLYLSGTPNPLDRGIRCYSKCLGAFLKCFGFAREYQYGNRTYYVNRKSLAKYNYQAPAPIPLPSIPIQESLHDKIRNNFPKAIEELQGMSLDKFKQTLKDSKFLGLLVVYDAKIQPLYLGLKQDKRILLGEALIKNKSYVIGKIAGFWEKEEALRAYGSCKNNKEMLLDLCKWCNGKAFFPDILEAMSEEDFREVVRSKMPLKPEIITPILAKDKVKGLDFLYACSSLREYAPYYSPELKNEVLLRLSNAPENYFHGIGVDDEQAFEVISEFLKSKSTKDVGAFSKSDPFDFKGGLYLGLFQKLITHLDETSAVHFVNGFWGSEKIDIGVKVEGLGIIHKTFPISEDTYPDKLSKFMTAILDQMRLSGTWESFLSETIPDYKDGLNGPATLAFKSLIIAAVARGIMDDAFKPLLRTLLKHENILTGYKILTSEGLHPILDKGLKEEEKKELFALARSLSPSIFDRLLTPDQLQEFALRWENCHPELQKKWLQHLKKSCPKGYFHKIDGKDGKQLKIAKALMETMTEKELTAFSGQDPFDIKTSGFSSGVFSYLISNLDNTDAKCFVMGLWGNEHIDTKMKVEGLSVIYSTLQDVLYSDNLYSCMGAVLYQLGGDWDTFLSKTIPQYEDGPTGPHHQAFFALLVIAICNGMNYEEDKCLVETLLKKHEKLLIDYELLGPYGVHQTLANELLHKEKDFFALACASSETLNKLLTVV